MVLPVAFVAVKTYVVVALGVTLRLVPVTVPIPWSMPSDVAPVTLQLRVLACPPVMDAGEAENEAMTGAEPATTAATVTVACAVLVPDEFVAVSVYVVVATGLILTLVPVTTPIPWSMLSNVAPATFQLNVLLAPALIEAGDAEKEAMLGPVGPTMLPKFAPHAPNKTKAVAQQVAYPNLRAAPAISTFVIEGMTTPLVYYSPAAT